MDKTNIPIISPNISPSPLDIPPTSSRFPLTLIIKIIISLVVATTIGTGASLATRIWDPLWNPFRPNPEEVISKMVENMKNIERVHYIAEYFIEKKMADESIGLVYGTTKWEVNLDFSNPDGIQAVGLIYDKVESEESGFSVELEVVSTGKLTFIKIIKSDSQEIPKDQWVGLPFIWDDYKSIIEEVITAFKNEEVYSVYSLEQELPDEKINGVKVYHYKVSFKGNVSFLMTNNFGDLSPGNSMDIYIGKEDNLIYKLTLSGDNEVDSDASSASFYVEFSSYNEPLPDSYKAKNEVFTYTYVDKKNIFIEAYLWSFGSIAEIYALDNHKSYSGFCESSYIDKAVNSLEGTGAILFCNDTSGSWAACAQLVSDSAVYYCVDYQGNSKEVNGSCDNNWAHISCPTLK